MKTLKILKSASSFIYKTQFEELGICKIKSEFIFDAIKFDYTSLPELYIIPKEMDVSFGIIGDCQQTYSVLFRDNYFTEEELQHFSVILDFDIVSNPYFPEKKQASLIHVKSKYTRITSLIKIINNRYYLLMYSSTRTERARCAAEDFFGDNIFYIHGIWEVELTDPQ